MSQEKPSSGEEQRKPPPARPLGFRKGVMFTSTAAAINIAFLFLETMVAARLLDPENFGAYVLLVVVVNFLVSATDFGCKTAVTHLISSSQPARRAALAHSVLLFRLLVLVGVSVLIILGKNLLLVLDRSGALASYAPYVPLMLAGISLDELFLAMLQGFRAYRRMAASQILRSVLRLALTVLFLAVLDLGVDGLVYSWTISFAAAALYAYLALPISKRPSFQRPLLGEVLRFGLPLQMSRFLWFGSSRVDTLLIGAFLGPASVAFYNVATRIPTAMQQLSDSYTAVFFPTMSALLAEGKRGHAKQLLDHSLRLISFALALAALIAFLFNREIVTLVFSEKYAASGTAFALLMLAFHMAFLVNLMGYALTAAGFPVRSLNVNLIRATLSVLGSLVLIPLLGFVGPAYASVASYYSANPLCVLLLRRSEIRVAVTPYAKQTLLLLLCVASYWWIQPAGVIYKLVFPVLFIVLNLMLSTVTRSDLNILLPEVITAGTATWREPLHNEER